MKVIGTTELTSVKILTKEDVLKNKMIEALMYCQDYFIMMGSKNHYASRDARDKTSAILKELNITSITDMEAYLNKIQ
jgi:hypothetical protein